MAEKFYLVSDDSYRLNLFKNEILKNDPEGEVFLETDLSLLCNAFVGPINN